MTQVSWAPKPAKKRVFTRGFHTHGGPDDRYPRIFSRRVPFTLVREELFKTREKAVAAAKHNGRFPYFAIVEMRYYPDATKTHVSGHPVVRGYALYRAYARDVKHIENQLHAKHGGGITMYMGNSEYW